MYFALTVIKMLFSLSICGASSAGGGVYIGNGGNLTDGTAVSMDQIRIALPELQLPIRAWLYQSTAPEQQEILKILAWVRIQFRVTEPCPSTSGPRDGSVIKLDRLAPVICISGFTLSQKLTSKSMRPELEGLLLHEISHLVGADEEKAVALQTAYLKDRATFANSEVEALFHAHILVLDYVNENADWTQEGLYRLLDSHFQKKFLTYPWFEMKKWMQQERKTAENLRQNLIGLKVKMESDLKSRFLLQESQSY